MSGISDHNARKLIEKKVMMPEDSWDVSGTSREAIVDIDDDQYADDVISLLMANGAKIVSVNKVSKNLEDLFTEVMQEKI